MIAEALEYHSQGFNVLPCFEETKKPIVRWKHWQSRGQTQADVERLFATHTGNIAVLGGVSCIPNAGFRYYIDCEDHGLFQELSDEVQRLNGETWRSKTKRGGHIYLRSEKPIGLTKGQGFEIRGMGGYVLAPPSMHPGGLQYEFVARPPEIALANELSFTQVKYVELPKLRLPRLAKRILAADEETLAKYRSRSEVDHALIQCLVNVGFELQDIRGLIEKGSYPSHVRELDEKRKSTYYFREVAKCQSREDRADFAEAKQQAQIYRTWVMDQTSKAITGNSRTGPTDKNVLLTHIARSEKAGKGTYHLSVRDGAEMAQMSVRTFSKATKRLIKAGRIKAGRSAVLVLANQYTLVIPDAQSDTLTHNNNVCKCGTSCTDPYAFDTAGVFEHAGLGRHTGDTWRALLNVFVTFNELVERTGKQPRTVRRHLARLKEFGLLITDGERFTAKSEDLEQVGQHLETSEIGSKRQRQHVREREAYRKQFGRPKPARTKR